jgi:chemotaxis protein MotB
MFRQIFSLAVIVMFLLSITACMVTKGTYMEKVAEADNQEKQLVSLQQKQQFLTYENNELKDKVKKLTTDRDELKATLDEMKKKESFVESESNAYKQLMQEMKNEIAKGQVTISELKGKLTLDVVDRILFASGQAEVTKDGLAVLKRVNNILKNVTDKSIRIEGHTDNVQIKGQLTKKYPTNWELSAARAINVTRYLQKQGIDPALLSATAYGEFKPVAGNDSSEGRAKNRRIAIILLPKD